MFTVSRDRNITYCAHPPGDALCFDSAGELAALADRQSWSRQDLEAIWNGFAGTVPFDDLRPVKKFRNRPYGIARIWEVIQRLKPARTPEVKTEFKADTKRAEVLRMLQREGGASLAELAAKFSWQRHTVRGFISTLGAKHGVKIVSEKHETRGRVYRIA